jgi:hypothetical protein
MRALRLALTGALAITAPIIAHANGPGSNLRPANEGASANVVLVGDGAVRAGIRRRLGAARPLGAQSNGTGGRVLLTGDQTIRTAAGAPMAGRRCRLTGCGSLGVQSSITPSRTGEARRAGGAIRSR